MLDALMWDAAGLVSVVVQDQHTGEVRMLAHANAEALTATLETGFAHFFSRSRGRLWKKGESSGNVIAVSEIWADCDGDALVYLADPAGPSCHTGRRTCFFRRVGTAGIRDDSREHGAPTLFRLGAALGARTESEASQSYTKSLLEKGAAKIEEKLREEAAELGQAIGSESDDRVISEAADVLYHLMVGLLSRGLSLRDVEVELGRRFGVSGHAEKAARSRATDT